ncbi:hypothetical protein M406DRAFT_354736 [Cryphonectria parasitica EP155]|uniref:Uncharacterized protein n=1 Tax=Cryphonectria parasitica (strain ATCC 38755 / EP155) TaxID=660469 RepID=A0A9P5CVN0_CRYP1|nr:uncharacterized protein M406DRAFT_354736 [Cryphonectria parasitica EP155]KAF3771216.1 hypothetical protein M406DRAFT_354736 [Cryphonectria parasitica EP155]
MQTTTTFSLLAAALSGLASAAIPNVYINAFSYETDVNTTLTLFLGEVFTDSTALNQVSTLYLTGLSNAELSIDTIVCTPYKDAEASVIGGLPFYAASPAAFLSTNEVVIGSIYCSSTGLSYY